MAGVLRGVAARLEPRRLGVLAGALTVAVIDLVVVVTASEDGPASAVAAEAAGPAVEARSRAQTTTTAPPTTTTVPSTTTTAPATTTTAAPPTTAAPTTTAAPPPNAGRTAGVGDWSLGPSRRLGALVHVSARTDAQTHGAPHGSHDPHHP